MKYKFEKGNQLRKGRIPWNKGKPHSKATREKMRKAAIERERSEEEIERVRNLFKGNKHSKKTKEEMSKIRKLWWENPNNKEKLSGKNSPTWKGGKIECICFYCGKRFYSIHTRVRKAKRLFCSVYCHNTWASGENSYAWRGGISIKPWPKEFNDKLKERIRKRDNYVCQFCGIKQVNLNNHHKKLGVHHIDYDKQNNENQDFVSLCCSCHCKTNYDRDKWSFLFDTLNEIRMTEWQN